VGTWWVEDNYAGQADEIALASFNQDLAFPGGDAVPVGGYGRCIEKFAEGLDIRTSTKVTRVEHSESGVTVKTSAGTFTAGDVVVTVPLGVLKAAAIAFDPPLSEARQGAIGRLAMGAYEKVVLRFTADFYSETGDYFWHMTRGPGAYPYAEDTQRFTGSPGMTFLSAGSSGKRIASLSTSGAVDGAMRAVREMWSEATVGDPTASASTSWWEDEFSRGSYSFLPVGSAPGDMDAVGGLEASHVRFAGEHTDARFYGTVHGALISGLREANAILGTDVREVPTSL